MKVHTPTKLIERPAHSIPPAKWHLNPDLDSMEAKVLCLYMWVHADGYVHVYIYVWTHTSF